MWVWVLALLYDGLCDSELVTYPPFHSSSVTWAWQFPTPGMQCQVGCYVDSHCGWTLPSK